MGAKSGLDLLLILVLIPQPRMALRHSQASPGNQQQPAIPPAITAIFAKTPQDITPTPDGMKVLEATYRQSPKNAKTIQGAEQGRNNAASSLPPFGTGMQATLYAVAADSHGKSAIPEKGSNNVPMDAGRSSTWSKAITSANDQNKVGIAADVSASIGAVSLSLQTSGGKGVVSGMAGPAMIDTFTVPGVYDKAHPKYVTLDFELHINQLSAAGDQYVVAAKAILLGLVEPSQTKPGDLVGSTQGVALIDTRCHNMNDGSGCTEEGKSSTGGGTSILRGNVTAVAGSTFRLELSGRGNLIDGAVTHEVVASHTLSVRANVCVKPAEPGPLLTTASGFNYTGYCE